MMIDGGIFINGLPIIVVLEDIATFPPFILKFLIVNISTYLGCLDVSVIIANIGPG